MERYCYCSKIQPGKSDMIRTHWQQKSQKSDALSKPEIDFRDSLGLHGFEAWLQSTPHGDFMIHCLEGESLHGIFDGLQAQIKAHNEIALELQAFYQSVLGKDYSSPSVQPSIECLLDISLQPKTPNFIKRGFFFPLLSHKEDEHRRFRQESMTKCRHQHEASMAAFHVHRLTTWLQQTANEKFIVVYTERSADTPATSQQRLAMGNRSKEWQEISEILADHTGLSHDQLSPETEWLTQPITAIV